MTKGRDAESIRSIWTVRKSIYGFDSIKRVVPSTTDDTESRPIWTGVLVQCFSANYVTSSLSGMMNMTAVSVRCRFVVVAIFDLDNQ